uniref:Uncharacterized protein n=1 Tax=Strix occidentalis caurina TaxID=311401 RepID=A0A8D0KV17_STROC
MSVRCQHKGFSLVQDLHNLKRLCGHFSTTHYPKIQKASNCRTLEPGKGSWAGTFCALPASGFSLINHCSPLWDTLPTSLAHTSVAGPGPDSTAARGAHRDAPYSTTASRNRLDTAQMATTSHTFVVAAAAAAAAAGPAASAPSTSDTLSVAVAERAGSPWSRTTITSLCRGPSASSSARAVLTSPLYSPTRNGPFPRGSHSS